MHVVLRDQNAGVSRDTLYLERVGTRLAHSRQASAAESKGGSGQPSTPSAPSRAATSASRSARSRSRRWEKPSSSRGLP
jgi:hypothetical protein